MPGFNIDKTEGIGSSVITVTPTEMNTTGSDYTSYLKLTFEDGTIQNILLTQKAGTYSYKYTFSVSPQVIPVDSNGGSYTVSVTSIRETYLNSELIETDEDWPYTISEVEGITWNGNTFTVGTNYVSWDTTRTVTFTQADSGNTVEIIIQSLSADVSSSTTFLVSPVELSFDSYQDMSKSISVTSTKTTTVNGVDTTVDVDWSVSSKPDWITVSGTTVTADENTSTSSRSGSLVLVQDESGNTATVAISQAAASVSTSYTFTSSNVSVGATAGTTTISVTSTKTVTVNDTPTTTSLGWSVTSTSSWISVSGSTVTYEENTSSSSRTGSIVLTQDESGRTLTITVTQSAASISESYTFTVDPTSIASSASGGTASFTVTSTKTTTVNGSASTETLSWSVTSNPSWVTISGSTITFAENTSDARSGSIVLTQEESGRTATIAISQAAVSTSTSYEFSANPTTFNVSALTGTVTTVITSTKTVTTNGNPVTNGIGYSGVCNDDWITSAIDGTITYEENTTSSSRTGTITYTQNESGYQFTITITQAAASMDTTYTFSVSPTSMSFGYDDDSQTFTITSTKTVTTNGQSETTTLSYSSSSSVSWASVSSNSVSVTENTGSSRTGTITFTQAESGYTCTIALTQSAASVSTSYTFSVSPTSLSYTADGGSSTLTVTSTKTTTTNGNAVTSSLGWSVQSSPSWVTISGSTVTVASTTNTSAQSGTIVLVQDESGRTVSISVSQAAYVSQDISYIYAIRFQDEDESEYSQEKSVTVAATGDVSVLIALRSRKYTGDTYEFQPNTLTMDCDWWRFSDGSSSLRMESTGDTFTWVMDPNYLFKSVTGTMTGVQDESGNELYLHVTRQASELTYGGIISIGTFQSTLSGLTPSDSYYDNNETSISLYNGINIEGRVSGRFTISGQAYEHIIQDDGTVTKTLSSLKFYTDTANGIFNTSSTATEYGYEITDAVYKVMGTDASWDSTSVYQTGFTAQNLVVEPVGTSPHTYLASLPYNENSTTTAGIARSEQVTVVCNDTIVSSSITVQQTNDLTLSTLFTLTGTAVLRFYDNSDTLLGTYTSNYSLNEEKETGIISSARLWYLSGDNITWDYSAATYFTVDMSITGQVYCIDNLDYSNHYPTSLYTLGASQTSPRFASDIDGDYTLDNQGNFEINVKGEGYGPGTFEVAMFRFGPQYEDIVSSLLPGLLSYLQVSITSLELTQSYDENYQSEYSIERINFYEDTTRTGDNYVLISQTDEDILSQHSVTYTYRQTGCSDAVGNSGNPIYRCDVYFRAVGVITTEFTYTIYPSSIDVEISEASNTINDQQIITGAEVVNQNDTNDGNYILRFYYDLAVFYSGFSQRTVPVTVNCNWPGGYTVTVGAFRIQVMFTS